VIPIGYPYNNPAPSDNNKTKKAKQLRITNDGKSKKTTMNENDNLN
jgi:hypothetical protein